MKAKILLIFICFSSSSYALQQSIWKNFLKTFNEYKHQIAKTCKAKQMLNEENKKLGTQKLLLDETQNIRSALWKVQNDKAENDGSTLDRIDDINSEELIGALRLAQNKEAKNIESILPVLKEYFGSVIEGIKRGKNLAQAYNELMSATDDAPPSLSGQTESIKKQIISKQARPQGIQGAVSWKKEAEHMMKAECTIECRNTNTCEDHFEFKEGAAVYFAEHEDMLEKYPASIGVYREMKKKIIEQGNGIKKGKKEVKCIPVSYINPISKQFDYKRCSADCDSQWKEKLDLIQQKNLAAINAINSVMKDFTLQQIDYKQSLLNLKEQYYTCLNNPEYNKCLADCEIQWKEKIDASQQKNKYINQAIEEAIKDLDAPGINYTQRIVDLQDSRNKIFPKKKKQPNEKEL